MVTAHSLDLFTRGPQFTGRQVYVRFLTFNFAFVNVYCSLFFFNKKVSIWKRSFDITALLVKQWPANPLPQPCSVPEAVCPRSQPGSGSCCYGAGRGMAGRGLPVLPGVRPSGSQALGRLPLISLYRQTCSRASPHTAAFSGKSLQSPWPETSRPCFLRPQRPQSQQSGWVGDTVSPPPQSGVSGALFPPTPASPGGCQAPTSWNLTPKVTSSAPHLIPDRR